MIEPSMYGWRRKLLANRKSSEARDRERLGMGMGAGVSHEGASRAKSGHRAPDCHTTFMSRRWYTGLSLSGADGVRRVSGQSCAKNARAALELAKPTVPSSMLEGYLASITELLQEGGFEENGALLDVLTNPR
jgi:hypothetical protein